jgi:SAM-dependent methyltransferase
MNAVARDFDRIAAAQRADRWNHNNHYHRLMLGFLPAGREAALDLGCGAGDLLELLAGKFRRVTGLDFSPIMVAQARARLKGRAGARVIMADARTFTFRPNSLDFIVSAAAFHHLTLRNLLPRLKVALKPGGVLVNLDLYKLRTPADFLTLAAATPVNFIVDRLRNFGRPETAEEKAAWRAHAAHDRYSSLVEIRRIARELLPGARVRRLLYWRYLLVWKK